MRRKCLSVCLGMLLVLLAFSGCGNSPSGSNEISSEPIISSGVSTFFFEPDSNVSTPSVDLSKPMILITSGGETICTYESILSDFSWDGESFRCADCEPVGSKLPKITDQLSAVTYADDFSIQYREDASFMYIAIYDDDFERLYNAVDLSYIKELPEGTYYIVIDVKKQGRFIISENKYEVSGYECAFKLMVD